MSALIRRSFCSPLVLFSWLAALAFVALLPPRVARAFGDEGSFNPRVLLTGTAHWGQGPRATGPARWSWELARRTSAPARMVPTTVSADSSRLLAEPFAIWTGETAVEPLTEREIQNLRRFFSIGGTLFVDEGAPERGAFLPSARRELNRVLTDALTSPLPDTHVLYHSFYLVRHPAGRTLTSKPLDAIVRGGNAQVLFSPVDVLGALARDTTGSPTLSVLPGGDSQREDATRFAVNIAMYVLCSTYKDDQVHVTALMRRHASSK